MVVKLNVEKTLLFYVLVAFSFLFFFFSKKPYVFIKVAVWPHALINGGKTFNSEWILCDLTRHVAWLHFSCGLETGGCVDSPMFGGAVQTAWL